MAAAVASELRGREVGLLAVGEVAPGAARHWASLGLGRVGVDAPVLVALVDGEEPALPENVVATVRSRGTDPTTRLDGLRRMGDLIASRLSTDPPPEARP